jgi:hypothetical protein
MSMVLFGALFREIATAETRSITIPPALASELDVPADEYAFLDLYCVERNCDCRRVMINVMARTSGKHLATINHAFEPPAPKQDISDQTFLDPLNPQSRWSEQFLQIFESMLTDREYAERLRRHYKIVKDALKDPKHPIHRIGVVKAAERDRREMYGE